MENLLIILHFVVIQGLWEDVLGDQGDKDLANCVEFHTTIVDFSGSVGGIFLKDGTGQGD